MVQIITIALKGVADCEKATFLVKRDVWTSSQTAVILITSKVYN
jgi:hypothetical protein